MRLALLILTVVAAHAQTHSVVLTWADTTNPVGTTYNVYRAASVCSGTPAFTRIAAAVPVKNYTDTTVQPGNYCYRVTSVLNGIESPPSNNAPAPVPPFVPSGLSVTVQ